MDSNLKQLLYTHTETEEWHRTHPGELSPRYNRVETTTINGEEVYLFDWKETLDENPVGLIKESRFTDIPPHMNRDMELNYVYDGVCTFIVNGRRLLLKKGDVLICNTGVVRSVPYVKGARYRHFNRFQKRNVRFVVPEPATRRVTINESPI